MLVPSENSWQEFWIETILSPGKKMKKDTLNLKYLNTKASPAFLFQLADDKTNNMTYVQSEDSGQTGCLPSLIRVTAVRFMGS